MKKLFTLILGPSLAFAMLVVFSVQTASGTSLNLENNGVTLRPELSAKKAQNNLVATNSATVTMVVVPSGDC